MPSWRMEREYRARLLSAYYRPWTSSRQQASRSVPFAGDLDLSSQKRLRGKKSVQRSYGKAWSGYVRGHIVSRPAARMITQALMQLPADSREPTQGADEEEGNACLDPLPGDAEPQLGATDVRGLLRKVALPPAGSGGCLSKQIQSAMARGDRLWGSLLASLQNADAEMGGDEQGRTVQVPPMVSFTGEQDAPRGCSKKQRTTPNPVNSARSRSRPMRDNSRS